MNGQKTDEIYFRSHIKKNERRIILMTEVCMYAALSALSLFVPKAPVELVENMVKTVKAMTAEKNNRLGKTAAEPEKAPVRQTKKSNPCL